ncbi:MAG: FecR domain-containing protein [Lachnospiraceae bacterium]|nr:FecR domain-containing protein [Lachnospiraceae bacterium]
METEQRTDNRKKKIIALAALLAAALIGVLLFFLLSKNDLMAVDIRIRRMVGTVNLHNEKGKELSPAERMRLNSGQRLKTAEESLVMLSLDETRLITLEESSKAQIKAAGKKLEFDLEEGELFFNVTEKLEEVESFDIRTSTMLCGIRGTSGFVGEDETGHETLMVTDGIVAVTGEHPVTHERIQTLVFAGQQVTIYLDDEAEGDARISFRVQRFKEEDLPALALDAIRKDEKLQSRITQATGFSTKKPVELADVTSFKGVSMYGQAVEELSAAGIEDAIPLMGRTAKEMVATANRAAETAGQDLPLEITIIKGMRGVLDTAKAAGCDPAETSALMTGSSDCVDATVGKAREAGLSGDDLVGVAQTVTDTLSSAVGQMNCTLSWRGISHVLQPGPQETLRFRSRCRQVM